MRPLKKYHFAVAALLLGALIDLSAITAWSHPVFGSIFLAISVLAIGLLSLRDLRIGVFAVIVELMWGSFGRWMTFSGWGISLSFRMSLFLVVIVATLWHLRTSQSRSDLMRLFANHPARWPFIFFGCSLVAALLLGLLRHDFASVLIDANAWGFLALAPGFLIVFQDPRNRRSATTIILAAGFYLLLRTSVLLFIFSHRLDGLWLGIYLWVRDARLGEVTIFPGGFPRVFLQSMVWLFPVLTLSWSRLRHSRMAIMLWGLSGAILVVSLSRSYWVGILTLIGIWMLSIGWTLMQRKSVRGEIRKASKAVISIFAALVVLIVVVRFPFPTPITTATLSSTLASRLVADEAVGNRWQQIGPLTRAILERPLIGHGFGKAISYESKDPRTLAAFPQGTYTTTAFEWGFLDDLLERGLLGVIIELWLLIVLVVHGIRQRGDVRALALAMISLVVIHATSPYLNHPLGLGMLIILFALLSVPPTLQHQKLAEPLSL
jgi:hypothetical protein